MNEAITYDDVLLVPSYNHWESRKVVDISVQDRTGKLSLDLPLMTANMDTITEAEMVNFIGAKGGIGVLHRFNKSSPTPFAVLPQSILLYIFAGPTPDSST